jgi:hypothetical protein
VQAFRFYLYAVRQLPAILGKAALWYITILTAIGSTIGYLGIRQGKSLVSWWQGLSPLWGAVVPVVLVGVVLFLVAVHRQFREVERERDALKEKLDADERRATIAVGLDHLYEWGATLRMEVFNSTDETPVSECQDKLKEWRRGLWDYLERHVSTGQARYVDGVASVKAFTIMGMKSNTTRNEKETIILHIDERLARLAEVMREY